MGDQLEGQLDLLIQQLQNDPLLSDPTRESDEESEEETFPDYVRMIEQRAKQDEWDFREIFASSGVHPAALERAAELALELDKPEVLDNLAEDWPRDLDVITLADKAMRQSKWWAMEKLGKLISAFPIEKMISWAEKCRKEDIRSVISAVPGMSCIEVYDRFIKLHCEDRELVTFLVESGGRSIGPVIDQAMHRGDQETLAWSIELAKKYCGG